MRIASTLLLVSSLLVTALPAYAGPPTEDEKVQARALADKGFELYKAGKYAEAVDAFEKANKLVDAPTLAYALAKAKAGAGKLVEARALYRKVIDLKLPPDAPDQFKGAQESSKKEIALVDARIPRLRVDVKALGKAVKVRVDEALVTEEALKWPLELNPGEHLIVAVPSGEVGISRTVTLKEGDKLLLEIEPPRIGIPPLPPRVDDGKAADKAKEAYVKPERMSVVPMIIAYGAGAIGLALGAGMGAVTLGKKSELIGAGNPYGCTADNAGGYTCSDPEAQKVLDGASTTAGISTAGFVLGAVGVAAGVTLTVVWARSGKSAPPKVGTLIGPGYVGLQGAF